MQIRFADSRPSGDYALVLPVAGKDRSSLGLGSSQTAVSAALRPPALRGRGVIGHASSSSMRTARSGACLLVGTGAGSLPAEAAEKLGGTAAARLQTSGEKTSRHRSFGLSAMIADTAARIALGAALRSWRYDRYRTTLKDNQKPTLAKRSS